MDPMSQIRNAIHVLLEERDEYRAEALQLRLLIGTMEKQIERLTLREAVCGCWWCRLRRWALRLTGVPCDHCGRLRRVEDVIVSGSFVTCKEENCEESEARRKLREQLRQTGGFFGSD